MRSTVWGFLCACLLLTSSAARAQSFFAGFVGGAAITNSVVTNPDDFTFRSAHKYLVGATAEIGLPYALKLEGDFIFNPLNFEVGSNPPPRFAANSIYDYHVFEVPVLVKVPLTNGHIRPFLEGGPTFRFVPNASLNVSHFGVVAGGGLEFGPRRYLRISPEIRYIRWAPDSLIVVNNAHVSGEQLNQIELLVGIAF